MSLSSEIPIENISDGHVFLPEGRQIPSLKSLVYRVQAVNAEDSQSVRGPGPEIPSVSSFYFRNPETAVAVNPETPAARSSLIDPVSALTPVFGSPLAQPVATNEGPTPVVGPPPSQPVELSAVPGPQPERCGLHLLLNNVESYPPHPNQGPPIPMWEISHSPDTLSSNEIGKISPDLTKEHWNPQFPKTNGQRCNRCANRCIRQCHCSPLTKKRRHCRPPCRPPQNMSCCVPPCGSAMPYTQVNAFNLQGFPPERTSNPQSAWVPPLEYRGFGQPSFSPPPDAPAYIPPPSPLFAPPPEAPVFIPPPPPSASFYPPANFGPGPPPSLSPPMNFLSPPTPSISPRMSSGPLPPPLFSPPMNFAPRPTHSFSPPMNSGPRPTHSFSPPMSFAPRPTPLFSPPMNSGPPPRPPSMHQKPPQKPVVPPQIQFPMPSRDLLIQPPKPQLVAPPPRPQPFTNPGLLPPGLNPSSMISSGCIPYPSAEPCIPCAHRPKCEEYVSLFELCSELI